MGALLGPLLDLLSNSLSDRFGLYALLAGLVGNVLLLLADRFLIRAKRLNVRTLTNSNWLARASRTERGGKGLPVTVLGADGQPIVDPSMVSLRFKNASTFDIEADDYDPPITVSFPDRDVIRAEITEAGNRSRLDAALRRRIADDPGFTIDTHLVTVPPVHLNTRDRFKLVVLLSGSGKGLELEGRIKRGRLVDDTHPRRWTLTTVGGGLALLLAGALVVLLLVQPSLLRARSTVPCAPGDLTIVGSTAFEQAAERAKDVYRQSCGEANITVSATGSRAGLEQLANAPRLSQQRLLALSDGRADDPRLDGTPLAVAVFAVVINADAGVRDLTAAQVRDLYAGRVTNWSRLGGANLPVRLVGRDLNSGSRRAFERYLLRSGQPRPSSRDCTARDLQPDATILACETGSTGQLLERVNRVSGAIGYADAATANPTGYPNLVPARLDGALPVANQLSSAGHPQGYPFWTIEYVYSSDPPPAGSLRASFLAYLKTDSARVVLREAGYLPCINQDEKPVAQCSRPQQ